MARWTHPQTTGGAWLESETSPGADWYLMDAPAPVLDAGLQQPDFGMTRFDYYTKYPWRRPSLNLNIVGADQYYGADLSAGRLPIFRGVAPGAGGALAIVGGITRFSWLLGLVGGAGTAIGRQLVAWARGIGVGASVAWESLPGWVRAILVPLGITAGTLQIDDIFGVAGELLPFLPGGGGEAPPAFSGQVARTWVANGTPFAQNVDGRMAARNRKGVWKVWRPKKPVILMPGGVTNLRALHRATAIVSAQLRRLRKDVAFQAPKARKPRTTTVVLPPGTHLARDVDV